MDSDHSVNQEIVSATGGDRDGPPKGQPKRSTALRTLPVAGVGPTFTDCVYPTVRRNFTGLEILWAHEYFPKPTFEEVTSDFQEQHRIVFLQHRIANLPPSPVALDEERACFDKVTRHALENCPKNARMQSFLCEQEIHADRWLGSNFCMQCNAYLFFRHGHENRAEPAVTNLCGFAHCMYPSHWYKYLTIPAGSPRFEHHDQTSFLQQLDVFLPQRVFLILDPRTFKPILWKNFEYNRQTVDHLHMDLLEGSYYDPFFYRSYKQPLGIRDDDGAVSENEEDLDPTDDNDSAADVLDELSEISMDDDMVLFLETGQDIIRDLEHWNLQNIIDEIMRLVD